MGPKHTGELWVDIGTPLPNPSGNAGVMLCYVKSSSFRAYNKQTNKQSKKSFLFVILYNIDFDLIVLKALCLKKRRANVVKQ